MPQSDPARSRRLSLPVTAARVLVRLYQLTLSPYLGGQCRFYPTCSNYALDALAKYGLWRGLGKSLWRIARCHPFSAGGHDPA
ncbi:putative membrane protein insertion efficiency factor [Desulfoferula mesophila]|uniref:Putative membrane protein insertion efficiency factor n=1 Tax=Desulfoferula mesophila TaxID=3058419 RepID=A0AAU9EG89_9BACT|nr:putative membrane protein insertion efficiency factor [Desulfoferula mesophilus]